jgi:hypothetical protein
MNGLLENSENNFQKSLDISVDYVVAQSISLLIADHGQYFDTTIWMFFVSKIMYVAAQKYTRNSFVCQILLQIRVHVFVWREAKIYTKLCSFEFCIQLPRKPRFWKTIFGKQILARMILHRSVCLLFPRKAKINTKVCSCEFCIQLPRQPRFWKTIFGKQILARMILHGFVCLLFPRKAMTNTKVCSCEFCIQLPRQPRFWKTIFGKQILARMILHGSVCLLFL